jgi:hypothetical protein
MSIMKSTGSGCRASTPMTEAGSQPGLVFANEHGYKSILQYCTLFRVLVRVQVRSFLGVQPEVQYFVVP